MIFFIRKSKRQVKLNSVKVLEANEVEENPEVESNLLTKRSNSES